MRSSEVFRCSWRKDCRSEKRCRARIFTPRFLRCGSARRNRFLRVLSLKMNGAAAADTSALRKARGGRNDGHECIFCKLLSDVLPNILLVAAIDIAGMSVAFPVGIGIALVLGVVLNYVTDPIGNAPLLFGGVLLVVLAIILDAVAYRKLPGGAAGVSTKGLVLSVACGLSMGFFYRFVAASMYPDFTRPDAGKLGPYGAVFVFAGGIFLSNFLLNTLMMKKPLVGTPVTYADYFKGGLGTHLTGILGGIIWGVGMSFNIIASGRAGFAISYGLGQGATMVAAFWGVFIWREFRTAPSGTSKLIAAMFACFLVGLALIIMARTS